MFASLLPLCSRVRTKTITLLYILGDWRCRTILVTGSLSMHSMGKSVFVQDIVLTTNGNTIRHSIKCANHLGTEAATPPPPQGGRGGRGVSPWDTPLYPHPAQVVKLFFQKKSQFFRRFFLTFSRLSSANVHAPSRSMRKKMKKSVRKMLTIGGLGCKLYA